MLNKIALLRSALSPSRIGFLIYFVTSRCNFHCPFCFYREEIDNGVKGQELTLGEVEQFARKTGPLAQLSLTGGEPFLRHDFAELAKIMATHCRPTYLTVPTNGSMTKVTAQFLEGFLPYFPETNVRLVLSIDGIGEDHDRIRATPGAFQKLQKTYEAVSPLRKRFKNLIVDANSCYSASNQDSLRGTLETLHGDYEFDNLSVTYARGELADPTLKKVSVQMYMELNDYLGSLPRKKESRFLYPVWRGVRDVSRDHLIRTIFHDEFVTQCVAGRKMVVVRENGDVAPCEILDKTFGNLRDSHYDIYALLRSKRGIGIRKYIKETRCRCSHECALASNVIWSPSIYPALAKAALKNVGK
ncbi:MAG: radical SAM protein [Proteobacteria bacterium]|nr:radical SAM protein [Pseudomonadota bacterium]MBU1593916.1 radical SAM protein [Pseudomonadota bacterium]